MVKKQVVLVVVLLCCTLILSSCSNPLSSIAEFFNKKPQTAINVETDPEVEVQSMSEVIAVQPGDTRASVMYYKDSEGFLVPVMRFVPKGELGIAKSAVAALIYSEENHEDLKPAGLIPTIPKGTKINGAVIKESGLAVIDFSKEFLNFSNEKAEELGVKAVLYTLTEFPNIKSVQIKVDGKELETLPNGTKINGALKRSEINLMAGETIGDKLSKVMVYYQKKGTGMYSYFVPVTKLVNGISNRAEAALLALIEGPMDGSSLQKSFPEGTELLGVEVKDGIAYINFSKEILGCRDQSQERAIIKSVALTMSELTEISRVKFFVDGKVVDEADGIGADEYIDVPVFVNFYE